jgi:pyruvate ferredoxin oxidoreductase beta subunit
MKGMTEMRRHGRGGQGRVRHLFQPQAQHVIDELQAEVDRRWARLLQRCDEG